MSRWLERSWGDHVRIARFVGIGDLKLYTVHAVDTVDEQDKDEDEGDLQAVL